MKKSNPTFQRTLENYHDSRKLRVMMIKMKGENNFDSVKLTATKYRRRFVSRVGAANTISGTIAKFLAGKYK